MHNEYERELAEIKSTFFGVEDHGMFCLDIGFKAMGWEQSIGMLGVEELDDNRERYTTPGLTKLLRDVFETVGVRSLDELRGRVVYVLRDDTRGIRGIESTGVQGQPSSQRILWKDYF